MTALGLNDLIEAKAKLRLFNSIKEKTTTLLFQWDLVQSNHNKIQHPIRYEGGRYRMLKQSAILATIQAFDSSFLNLCLKEEQEENV